MSVVVMLICGVAERGCRDLILINSLVYAALRIGVGSLGYLYKRSDLQGAIWIYVDQRSTTDYRMISTY